MVVESPLPSFLQRCKHEKKGEVAALGKDLLETQSTTGLEGACCCRDWLAGSCIIPGSQTKKDPHLLVMHPKLLLPIGKSTRDVDSMARVVPFDGGRNSAASRVDRW